MAELAAFQGESWQEVVCRICAHRFAIAAEDAGGTSVLLCQACAILVDWFGQEEAAGQESAAPQAETAAASQKQMDKPQRQERQRAHLASALDRWGELWRSLEEQE